MKSEWQIVRKALTNHRVAGADDLGRAVSDSTHVGPSAFDERAATPVFIELLPQLSNPKVAAVLASHLRRQWAQPHDFHDLRAAFERWATIDPTAGWHIGDALAATATIDELSVVLDFATATKYGTARQMIVHCLGRFEASPEVVTTLVSLMSDSDVALHAMSTLRRAIGPEAALPYLRHVHDEHWYDLVGVTAKHQIRQAEAELCKIRHLA